jgi:putative FmdB family regulatory protein
MPIFEFQCGACEQPFELLILPGRRKKPACPQCGSGRVHKQFSTFATGRARSSATASSGGGGGCASCAGGHCATCRG